jgi:hypothetical protein
VGVEADGHFGRRDPARELDERGRVGQLEANFLTGLADGGEPVRAVAFALVGVDRSARKDPRAAHEALLGIALGEQHLEFRGSAPEHDDRGRLARRRGRASPANS